MRISRREYTRLVQARALLQGIFTDPEGTMRVAMASCADLSSLEVGRLSGVSASSVRAWRNGQTGSLGLDSSARLLAWAMEYEHGPGWLGSDLSVSG